MSVLDWAVVAAYFLVIVAIGWWSKKRVHDVADFFTARGRIPWWLSGISHHMSGYSAVMFVAFAAVAYDYGFTVYVWWALTIGLGIGIGAFVFAPRWNRLRAKHGVNSPLEYLARRYNLPTQQVLAYSGAALKVVDIAAKWVAISVLLQGFADIPLVWGIVIAGIGTMAYVAIGGIWADVLTDMGQFVIQAVAGFVMLVAVGARLGFDYPWAMWGDLPDGHGDPIAGPVTTTLILAFLLVKTFEYNGGMWNLAQRYMASPSGSAARRSALLSSALWLVWPFILFLPMFAAPLIVPGLTNGEESYVALAVELLPAGLIGLMLAGFFSHTMAMVGSDCNVITAVITRDIAPVLVPRVKQLGAAAQLVMARVTTVLFVTLSMTIAITTGGEGFVLDTVVQLVAATMGPISIPLMLGLLPWFRRVGPTAAIVSWAGGLGVWYVVRYVVDGASESAIVGLPLATSLVLYTVVGLLRPEPSAERDALIDSLNTDPDPEPPNTKTKTLTN
ncbi:MULTISPECIES: sodium:solute symporter family protein [Streptomyces]|uniref:sodium:solute symporter family protein n=1 Tax=Streptomyces TaxID=1883 RepID=UPI00190771BC|nr:MULTISPECIES: sodium:solute symporter family protein [unclassified Streptomyces]MCU4747337.1 Na+:solute symporter [Streptomyces sp. G-5]QQN77968.1 Na+:solute symporter [Streptomyces sp. XC 2026]